LLILKLLNQRIPLFFVICFSEKYQTFHYSLYCLRFPYKHEVVQTDGTHIWSRLVFGFMRRLPIFVVYFIKLTVDQLVSE